MSVRLHDVTKEFLPARRGRRPLYRELINLGSAIKKGESAVVLDRISIEIPDGARIAVVGGNGVGKSTLLRLIAGIYQPTAGTVSVDGQVCCFLEPGAGAAPALPVRDNIFLYASLAGLNRAETRACLDRILSFSSLQDREFTWVEQLSFGYQQRLFIAILLEAMRLDKASVFLFDEFLVGVDQTFREKVESELDSVPKPSQIIIHASHDDDLIRRTCSHAILIEDGQINAYGSADEVLRKYRRLKSENPR